MPPRARKAALASVPEDEEVEAQASPPPSSSTPPLRPELRRQYQELEAQLEPRIAEIRSAMETAVLALRNECRRQLVKLPKSIRAMTLARLKEELPDDYGAAGLREVQAKLASLAAPVVAPGTRARASTRKRAPDEAATVLRTVQTRRMISRAGDAAAPADAAAAPPGMSGAPGAVTAAPQVPAPGAAGGKPPAPPRRAAGAAPPPAPVGTFNGRPLATPLPFAGAAVTMPVSFVTEQKPGRGRFTRAAPTPSAVVLEGTGGAQYAVASAEDLEALPGDEAAALVDVLRAQREFLDRLLASTVTTRRGPTRRKV